MKSILNQTFERNKTKGYEEDDLFKFIRIPFAMCVTKLFLSLIIQAPHLFCIEIKIIALKVNYFSLVLAISLIILFKENAEIGNSNFAGIALK